MSLFVAHDPLNDFVLNVRPRNSAMLIGLSDPVEPPDDSSDEVPPTVAAMMTAMTTNKMRTPTPANYDQREVKFKEPTSAHIGTYLLDTR